MRKEDDRFSHLKDEVHFKLRVEFAGGRSERHIHRAFHRVFIRYGIVPQLA